MQNAPKGGCPIAAALSPVLHSAFSILHSHARSSIPAQLRVLLRQTIPTFVHIAQMWATAYFSVVKNRMSRISIDVSDEEHKKLKALAALRGQSIKDFVLERALGGDESETAALKELEELLDGRIRAAQAGAVSRRTVSEVFAEAARKKSK